jgi:ribosome-binding factor A
MRRVDEAVREVLGDAVTHDLKDPRVGFVTVTEVRTSADLRQARVFVSVFGTEEEQAATLEGLASAHGILQGRIARELRMKRTPALEFRLDDTAEKAAKLEAIIEDVTEDAD